MVDPDRKVPDLYFKVVDPKLQVADLKAEVGELRSGGIPSNLTPASLAARNTQYIVKNALVPNHLTYLELLLLTG